MKRIFPLLLLSFAIMLFSACSDDASSGNTDDIDAATDTGSDAEVVEDTTGGDDASGDVGTDSSDSSESPDGGDADPDVDLQRVMTAVVVHADKDASRSSYGPVQLRTGGDLASPEVSQGTSTDFGSGHVHINATENGIYIIDRKSGTIRVLEKDETPGGMNYAHLGDIELQQAGDDDFSAHPQWVGESGDGQTLIISLFGSGELAKVSVDWDADTLGTPSFFSLASYDDDDNPDPTVVLTDEGHAFVALQRLEDGAPTKRGKVLIWDIENETGISTVSVLARQFHAGMKWLPNGDLAAGLAGEATDEGDPILDAGVQILERVNDASYTPQDDYAVSEQNLGGELWGFDFVDNEIGYAVARTTLGLRLRRFDRNFDGDQPQVSHVDTIPEPNGWLEVTPQGEHVWVADTTEGMVVLDAASGDLLDHDRLGFTDAPTSFAITESVDIAP